MQRTSSTSSGKIHPYPVAKVIEVVASSPKSFDDAVMVAIREASKTLRGLSGLEVQSFNVKMNGDKPVEYRVNCKVAFEVEH